MASPPHTVDVLHPLASLKWRKCRRLPVDMDNAQAVWLGDKLYVGGGVTSGTIRDFARLYIYTPTTDTWSEINTPVYYFALSTYYSQLVLVGGREYVGERRDRPATNKLWTLTGHDQWRETLPPMTTKRFSASAVEFAGKIIVTGGADDKVRNIDIVEVYNGHHWTKVQYLPKPSCFMKSTVLNGHWYLMGGVGQRKEVYYASLDSLVASCQPSEKPLTSVWKRLPDVLHIRSSTAVFGNRLIAVGGGGYPSPSSSIHAYSPHTQPWLHVGDVPVELHSTCTAVLPTGELMVIGGWSSPYMKESCVCKTNLNVTFDSGPVATISSTTPKGAPSIAPEGLIITHSLPTTAELSWSPLPLEKRSGVITGYTIQIVGPDSLREISVQDGNMTSIEVPGLRPFTTYTFHVSAMTKAGTGPVATVSSTTPKEAPSIAPEGLHITHSLPTTAELSWSPPPLEKRSGVITGYTIQVVGPDSSQEISMQDGNMTSIEVPGLRPSTSYTFHVSAMTKAGTGLVATISSTTPKEVQTEIEEKDAISAQLSELAAWKLQGVVQCGKTSVIVHPSQGQLVEWNGLKLHIHEGSLPEGLHQCKISIMVSLTGQYEIPENSCLVSAIFWLCCEPQCTFVKPITVEIQHCGTTENLSRLKIVRTFCSQKHLPYMFKPLLGGRFSAHPSYGVIEVNHFSGFGVTEEGPASDRKYYRQLFYRSYHSHPCAHDIHISFTWNTEPHINFVTEKYHEDGFLAGCHQVIELDGDVISIVLERAKWTKVMDGQWEIHPAQPMITKTELDDFKIGRGIPNCALVARPLCEDFPDLLHELTLNGVKPPLHELTLSYMLSRTNKKAYNSQSVPKLPQLEEPSADRECINDLQNQLSKGSGSQTGISIEEIAERAGVKPGILSKECSPVVSLDLAKFCVDWKLIGRRVDLTEADLTAVDGDNRTVEEKRVGMMEKWKSKFAYKATYRTFIEALLAEGRCAEAIEACKVIRAAEDDPELTDVSVKPELRDLLKELYSTKAADKWEDVGIMLGIKPSQLDAIKSAGNQISQSCLRETLKLYLQKDNPPPSWAAIVEALEFVGEETLAGQIKSKYCSSQ